MNLLQRLKAAFLPGRLDEGTRVVRIGSTGQTLAGVPVNADTALRNATVWACVTYLASTVAQLPWRVMQEQETGNKRVSTHPVERLIHKRPNPEMSSFAFRETIVGWAVRYGNGVAEIQRDARGVPVALWLIHPTRLEFKRDEITRELLFVVKDEDGTERVLRASDVYHVRGFGEGAVGLDVVSYAAESIGWAQATELFGSTFFGNGMNPSGFLYVPGKMSPEGKESLDEELEKRHRGVRKGSRVMILDGNLKFEKSSVEPNDAQFIETRQHQVEEICRWFRVPPHKVMHLLRGTFSNIEHQSIEVVVDAITPWVLRLEQEADYKFFGQNRQLFFTKMDLKGLLRGDFKSRQEGLQVMRRNGVINTNQWRRLEDMDEIGPDGDKYIVEGNMTTLEAVGQQQTPLPSLPPLDGDEEEAQTPVQRARQQAARALMH